MKVSGLLKVAERYVTDNAPTLLTAFAVTGTLTTAYLTGKASFKAADIIRDKEHTNALSEIDVDVELTTKDKAKLVWKCYIPPAASVAMTICCMVAANTISASRLAAMATAYAISDKNFSEYKEKVQEMFGEGKESKVRDALAEDAANASAEINVERGHGGDTLCLDKWTNRWFTSDMQSIRAAVNDLNAGLYRGTDRVATLGDFYNCLGLSEPRCAEDVGWNADAALDVQFSSVIRDGQPVLVMDFATTPFPIRGVFGTA